MIGGSIVSSQQQNFDQNQNEGTFNRTGMSKSGMMYNTMYGNHGGISQH
jgi:hypothetical protein